MLSKPDYELLVQYRNDFPAPDRSVVMQDQRFDRFVQQKLVTVSSYVRRSFPGVGECVVPDTWIVTLSGEDLLSEYEQAEKEQRAQNADKVSDRMFQIFLVLLTLVLTLFFEHCALPFLSALVE